MDPPRWDWIRIRGVPQPDLTKLAPSPIHASITSSWIRNEYRPLVEGVAHEFVSQRVSHVKQSDPWAMPAPRAACQEGAPVNKHSVVSRN
jgi:hypothetical protein